MIREKSKAKRLLAFLLSLAIAVTFMPSIGMAAAGEKETKGHVQNKLQNDYGVTSFKFEPAQNAVQVDDSMDDIRENYYEPYEEFEGSKVTITDDYGTKEYTFRYVDYDEPKGQGWDYYDDNDNLIPYVVRLHWVKPIEDFSKINAGTKLEYKAVLKNNASSEVIAESANTSYVTIIEGTKSNSRVVNGIRYRYSELFGSVYVNYCYGAKGNVSILDQLKIGDGDPHAVTVIDEYAFSYAAVSNVVIPNTIKRIGERAFYDTNMKEVTIPESVESIGEYAFGYVGVYDDEKGDVPAKVPGFVIYAKAGSEGAKYAAKNGFKCVDKEAETKAAAEAAAKKAAEEAAAKKAAEEAAAKKAAEEAAAKKAAAAKAAKVKAAKAAKAKIKAKALKGKKVKLSWKKVKNVSGFEIYQAAKKKGKYKKVATIKKAKATKWTSKKLKKIKKGKKVFYKVRVFTKIDGKKIYGKWSNIAAAKIK